jgi:hypothetical protein
LQAIGGNLRGETFAPHKEIAFKHSAFARLILNACSVRIRTVITTVITTDHKRAAVMKARAETVLDSWSVAFNISILRIFLVAQC